MSIQDLRPDPQDKPTFYLQNIYQLLADTNVSRASIPSTVAVPPPFSPPRYAIWVNLLWFSSLAISLTGALLATMFQQWTRRYIMLSQQLGNPIKRARLRQFFFSQVDWHIMLANDVVPTLLHLSVFLFFAGLLILLKNINLAVFIAVVVWVVLGVGAYGYITFLPVVQPADLYFSPLASLTWQFYTDIQYHVVNLPSWLRSLFKKGIHKNHNNDASARYPTGLTPFLGRLEKKAEEIIFGKSLELDANILKSLIDDLSEDDARETLFEAIPYFYSPQVLQMEDFKKHLSSDSVTKFRQSIDKFLDQTLSSESLSELARSHRFLTCLKATYQVLGKRARTSIAARIINSKNWIDVPTSPEIGHILRGWRTNTESWIATTGSCIIARIIAGEGEHDDTWKALTKCQLGMTDEELQQNLDHGNGVLMANLIATTRLFFENGLHFPDILRSISRFNVRDTLPDQQRDFCNLWDEIVQYVRDRHNGSDRVFILQEIRHVYDALHPTGPIAEAAPAHTAENDDHLHPERSFSLCANPQTHLFATTRYTTVSHQSAAPPTNEPEPPIVTLDIPHVSQQISPVSASPLTDNSSPLVPLSPLGAIPVEVHSHIPPALEFSYSTTTSRTLPTPREVSFSDPSATGTSTSTSRLGKGPV